MKPKAVLIGPPGAGKSTIGRRLAQALELELVDTDAEIERTTGRTIPEIFTHDGEPRFREIEESVVRDALQATDGIVSLGGGAILSDRTRELLQGTRSSTWRSVSPKGFAARGRTIIVRCWPAEIPRSSTRS